MQQDPPSSSSPSLTLHVVNAALSSPLNLSPSTPLSALRETLEDLMSIAASNQKLLFKGRALVGDERTLEELGLRDGSRVMLLGAKREGVERVEKGDREVVRSGKGYLKPGKLRSTGTATINRYIFHNLAPLPVPAPNHSADALRYLKRLAEDPSIVRIMREHRWSVGTLGEMHPLERPELLGVNTNMGELIQLRLRTDRLDGFRAYSEVRRVLLHELTHNVYGGHGTDFKTLNSQLNREAALYDAESTAGRTLAGGRRGDTYEPIPTPDRVDHGGHRLGAGGVGGGEGADVEGSGDSVGEREERRRRMREAAMRRMAGGGTGRG